MPITNVKIFPSIGVARLGNSPSASFIGPEIPGDRTPPPGGYKDDQCRVKRQAARFRLFGFDGNTLVKELTLDDPEVSAISWNVHLANKKASWRQFSGLNSNAPYRNGTVTDRASLEIDPGQRTLNGPNQAAGFNTGQFLGKFVPLGEMRTDAQSRLLVLGGFGTSGSVPTGLSITNYANNDGWYDDVSDGPVTAIVTVGGISITAEPAWVICAPPDFAPPLDSLTTLYDVLFQVALDKGLPGVSAPTTPSFTDDIYPILRRVFDMARVNNEAGSGHFDFDDPAAMSTSRRQTIFNRLRDPDNPGAAGAADMPKLWDDNNQQQLTVTKTQYDVIEKWQAGTFNNDWPGAPPSPSTTITPDGLTRAALEACVGAAFFPGIEASWFLRDTYDYSEPFRLDHAGLSASDISKQMAVPWQADFWKCYEYGGYGWWPAQRPDDVFPEGSSSAEEWTREIIATHEDMVSEWHKLGFVVEKGGTYVETERRKVCRSLTMITDRSHFSEDEVNAVLSGGSPALFPDALYVKVDGFAPAELGFANYTPSESQLASLAPPITIRHAGGSTVSGMTAPVQTVLFQNTSLPLSTLQRVTFVYQVSFQHTNAFTLESEPVTATATRNTLSTNGTLTLLKQPNPYMVDGPTHWLSTDVRVFQITEGQTRFGHTIANNAPGAITFINNVVSSFRTHGATNHPYDTVATDQQSSRLELSEKINGKRVFNFAVARVRYKGLVLDAEDVRVFFRLFTTAATGLDYDENATYRRTPAGTPVALLGLQGGHLVTIPCYGEARVDSAITPLSDQLDSLNKQTLEHAGQDEFLGFFGCWLDFNQTVPQFPLQPSPADGPWPSGRLSVQELIRGQHQCLVAEVHFSGDPIQPNATPAANDNLAQRNLAIVESDNPGSAATHTVQHTFEIRASRFLPEVTRQAHETIEQTPEVIAAVFQSAPPAAGPDELMIRWANLPRSSRATLYMPDVDVDEILRYAGQHYEVVGLERVDARTLRCQMGDVTYVPLPFNRQRNIAALLTIELPEKVRKGQQFDLVVHQISGRRRAILGAFQFSIPVSTRELLLQPEARQLSVLRHIALAIPEDDQWHPVFSRYLAQIGERVRGFGADPDTVLPSPDGSGGDLAAIARCTQLSWSYAILLALLVFVAGWHPISTILPEAVIALAAGALTWIWARQCGPSRCQVFTASAIGLAMGAAAVALLTLLGLGAAYLQTVLVIAVLLLCTIILTGVGVGCFRIGR